MILVKKSFKGIISYRVDRIEKKSISVSSEKTHHMFKEKGLITVHCQISQLVHVGVFHEVHNVLSIIGSKLRLNI